MTETDSQHSTQTDSKPVETLSYEQAFAELEETVEILEKDNLTLDTAMRLFERGQELSRYCTHLLEKAELRIQSLTNEGLTDFSEM